MNSTGGKIEQIQRKFPQTERKIDRKEYETKTFPFNLIGSADWISMSITDFTQP
ncbi:hypothetical protein [Sphingobacterium thalpophilum]|uniref:hypothetical protein n=1 Tax=Sphingobacterium thalpophilum TaxID=259 RepID=UPI003C70C927